MIEAIKTLKFKDFKKDNFCRNFVKTSKIKWYEYTYYFIKEKDMLRRVYLSFGRIPTFKEFHTNSWAILINVCFKDKEGNIITERAEWHNSEENINLKKFKTDIDVIKYLYEEKVISMLRDYSAWKEIS